jgi:hypothetical protein
VCGLRGRARWRLGGAGCPAEKIPLLVGHREQLHAPPSRTRSAGTRTRSRSVPRSPTGECKPASRWVKADRLHPLVSRESPRWWKLYTGRAGVERQFGRLKNEWALLPLRVRGLDRGRATRRLDDPCHARLRPRASASASSAAGDLSVLPHTHWPRSRSCAPQSPLPRRARTRVGTTAL